MGCVTLAQYSMTVDVTSRRPNGMNGLFIIWLGQMISGIASNITFFALPLWILSKTGTSGSALAYWESFFFASYLFVVLFAGVFVDRYNRRAMMLVYDFVLLSTTAILLVLIAANRLEVWHLYVTAIIQGVGYAFRLPAYSSVITLLVPRKQYVRANGMISLLYDTPEIFGPILAGILYMAVGLSGILAVNLITFVFSIGALLFVDIPPTPHTPEGDVSHTGFIKEALYGVRYILRRPGLLRIQLVFFFGNLFSGMALSVTAIYTMLALRTGGNTEVAGTIQSVGALAALLAGAFLSLFGRFKKPVRAILFGWLLSSLFGLTLLGIGQILVVWLIAKVIDAVFGPVVNVAIETFLQTKIPPDVQGRVFSASDFIAQAVIPITPLLAGYFGERVFEPAMRAGGALTSTFGWLVGTGPGAGFGLMIFLCGIGGTLVGLWGFISPAIRNVDQTLPDFEILPPVGLVRREPARPVKTGTRKSSKTSSRQKTISKPTKRKGTVSKSTGKK
jgi:MFS family permease